MRKRKPLKRMFDENDQWLRSGKRLYECIRKLALPVMKNYIKRGILRATWNMLSKVLSGPKRLSPY